MIIVNRVEISRIELGEYRSKIIVKVLDKRGMPFYRVKLESLKEDSFVAKHSNWFELEVSLV